jgi:hypothetical protein
VSFKDEMTAAKVHALGVVNELKQETVIELFSSIILDTPVDTGRLRGNWNTSLDRPNLMTSDETDKSGRKTIAEMQNKVLSAELSSSMYLTNNLPYAVAIENGHSKNRPQGMVRTNLARIKANLARAKK